MPKRTSSSAMALKTRCTAKFCIKPEGPISQVQKYSENNGNKPLSVKFASRNVRKLFQPTNLQVPFTLDAWSMERGYTWIATTHSEQQFSIHDHTYCQKWPYADTILWCW